MNETNKLKAVWEDLQEALEERIKKLEIMRETLDKEGVGKIMLSFDAESLDELIRIQKLHLLLNYYFVSKETGSLDMIELMEMTAQFFKECDNE